MNINYLPIHLVEKHIRYILGYDTNAEKIEKYADMSMLHLLTRCGHLSEYIEPLVERRADPNGEDQSPVGYTLFMTPLQSAIELSPTPDVIKTLVKCKADPNLKSPAGTPLLWSIYRGDRFLRVLLECGADVDQPIIYNQTIIETLRKKSKNDYDGSNRAMLTTVLEHKYRITKNQFIISYVSLMICICRTEENKSETSSLKPFVKHQMYDRNLLRIICSFLQPKKEVI